MALTGNRTPPSRRARVLIVFYVPSTSIKFGCWQDGFVSAARLLETDFEIEWYNVATDDARRLFAERDRFDFVLAKSNWGWIVDKFVRQVFAGSRPARGIMISGVQRPPPADEMRFYDVLYYETRWYLPQIARHPNVVHAFGVDTAVMCASPPQPKLYDWLTIGQFTPSKRQWKIVAKPGRKLAVGDMTNADAAVVDTLRQGGVELRDFVPYAELADVYRASHNVYIPAEIEGGGERSVLEARACGVPVHIEPDNAKLRELLESPIIWDERYYARQLRSGLLSVLSRGR